MIFLRNHRNLSFTDTRKEKFSTTLSVFVMRLRRSSAPLFRRSIKALYARKAETLSWSIPDFKSLSGTEKEREAGGRVIRDKIKSEVILFLAQIGIGAEIA